MKNAKRIIRVSTGGSRSCPHCAYYANAHDSFEATVNHLIKEHGYKLLHMGTESDLDQDNRLLQFTVAVLGIGKELPQNSHQATVAFPPLEDKPA